MKMQKNSIHVAQQLWSLANYEYFFQPYLIRIYFFIAFIELANFYRFTVFKNSIHIYVKMHKIQPRVYRHFCHFLFQYS